jgi:hypothetical protein
MQGVRKAEEGADATQHEGDGWVDWSGLAIRLKDLNPEFRGALRGLSLQVRFSRESSVYPTRNQMASVSFTEI